MNAIAEQFSAMLWSIFNRPRLIDLIDILLLTVILYELLIHVRHTRLSQTFKGIVILLIATWLRQKFDLGLWIIAVLGILGLLVAFSTAKANLKALRRDAEDAADAPPPPVAFNDHQ